MGNCVGATERLFTEQSGATAPHRQFQGRTRVASDRQLVRTLLTRSGVITPSEETR
jgi:hypothetical protein